MILQSHFTLTNRSYEDYIVTYSLFLTADEKITSNEPIEADKSVQEIRQEPYSLPDGFQWDTLNLDEPLVVRSLTNLV